MRHILTTSQFSAEEVATILSRAQKMEAQCQSGSIAKILADKIIACVFFEPSTRTRLSFETAALRLGASVISAEDAAGNSSAQKGETIEDTGRILSAYADAIVVRHPEKGSVSAMAAAATKPVINAGDGTHEHPSQGLLDLYTMQKEQGKLDGLHIAFVGDLLHSRTVASLVPLLLQHTGNTFHFVSPKQLALPAEHLADLQARNASFSQTEDLAEVLAQADVLYMTRVQKERFSSEAEYEKVKDAYVLRQGHLQTMKKTASIMHPLPRIYEIDRAVDADPRAAYFRQAQNGLYVRMALLAFVFGL